MKRRRKLTKREAKRFLDTKEGREWLERKIAEKHAARPDPGPLPARFARTKFPFKATINGEQAWVTRNAYGVQFDYEEEDDGETP